MATLSRGAPGEGGTERYGDEGAGKGTEGYEDERAEKDEAEYVGAE